MRKINRVLMFHGSDICNNTLNIFTDLLAESLNEKGIETGFIDLNAESSSLADEYVREINKGFDAAVAFNSYGYHETSMGKDKVFDYLNVPFYNWIVDHPNEHTDNLISTVRNYNVICIDRNHAKYVESHFHNVNSVFFIPLGGEKTKKDINMSHDAYLSRPYDITFCGSLGSLERIDSLIKELPEDIKKIITDVIDYMLSNADKSYEEALKLAFDSNNLILENDDFLELSQIFGLANQYVRQYTRKKAIELIASSGAIVDLFGEGWDELNGFDNIRRHGSVTYEESLDITANSKISLNVMPLFKDGLHDRVPTAMLNGALAATDMSRYMKETLCNDDKKILAIDDFRNAGDILKDALQNIDDAYAMALSGKSYAEKNLSWDRRADELIGIMLNE